jgi:NADP-dependent 3-hydroxy acid dehydrogenase YdfG
MANQIALITGASSGIGRATALAFARAGIDLALLGRSPERLAEVVDQATQLGVTARSYIVDLNKLDTVRDRVQQIVQEWGHIDILVNNAGAAHTGSLGEISLGAWQQTIDLNLSGVLQVVQGVLPAMRQRRSGTIVNLISIAGRQTFPDWGAYCVSKYGLVALTQVLAAEERPQGIRVTAIYPGSVNTALWDQPQVNANFDRAAMLDAETVAEAVLYAATANSQANIEEITVMPRAGAF